MLMSLFYKNKNSFIIFGKSANITSIHSPLTYKTSIFSSFFMNVKFVADAFLMKKHYALQLIKLLDNLNCKFVSCSTNREVKIHEKAYNIHYDVDEEKEKNRRTGTK